MLGLFYKECLSGIDGGKWDLKRDWW
jgi:hypothetical protein